ncbi:hypothetical protein FM106_14975 [Brachybacterium faecium]|nr:hypothetical protein FM106_14975 [Brachybacterium faecium]
MRLFFIFAEKTPTPFPKLNLTLKTFEAGVFGRLHLVYSTFIASYRRLKLIYI